MKKTYQNPKADYITMSLEQLIANSPVENGFDLSNPIGVTNETSGNLSRRTVWDDEEFDDEEF